MDWLPLAKFATNNAVSETTRVSLFFVNYSFHPWLSIEPTGPPAPDITLAWKQQYYQANAVANWFERILEQLTALTKQSQSCYKNNANDSHTSALYYNISDMVYVNTKNMKTNQLMKKGDDKWDGLYEVKEVYSRACCLKLSTNFCLYPVFHNYLLCSKTDTKGLV